MNFDSDLTILLGAYNILIKIHVKWNPATPDFDGDIAMIIFNEFIRPVCFAVKEITSKFVGSVVGWGIFDDKESCQIYREKLIFQLWAIAIVLEKTIY